MSRPKSSVIGFVDLGLTAKNAFGIKKLDTAISDISKYLIGSNLAVQRELEMIKNAQITSVLGMIEVNNRLELIENQMSDVVAEMKRQESAKDFLGDLKILLIGLEDELEKIDSLAETHLEFAALYAEDLDEFLKSNNIDYTLFKRMDQTGIKWAKSVIQQVGDKRKELQNRLE